MSFSCSPLKEELPKKVKRHLFCFGGPSVVQLNKGRCSRMPMTHNLRAFLKENHVSYKAFIHMSSFTAQQLAHSKHMTGEKVAKVVLLKSGSGYVMAVLPACYKVNFSSLKTILGDQELRLATEAEIRKLFPDCEIGTMPPFGNLYHLKVYVDESLTRQETIAFPAGTHMDAIELKYEDFAKLTKPEVEKFSVHT